MYKELQKKIINVAEKYTNLVEKLIDESADIKIDSTQLNLIGDGIRLLNHAASTLYKISACENSIPQTPNQTDALSDDMPFT